MNNTEKKTNWKDAKFDILQQAQNEDDIDLNNIEEEGIRSQPLPQLEFGGGASQKNFVIGVTTNDNIIKTSTSTSFKSSGISNSSKSIPSVSSKTNFKSKPSRPGTSPIKKANSSSKFTTVKNKSFITPDENINRTKSNVNNNSVPEEHFEELSKLIIEPKTSEDVLAKRLEEFNKEIQKLRAENSRVSKLREDYEKLNLKLQKDIKEFNIKKEQDIMQFEAFKEEETKKLAKERNQLTKDQKTFNDIRNKNYANITTSKKDKELIEQLKAQLAKVQEESKTKDSTNKHIIERYRKQLDDANNKILELNSLLTKLNTALAYSNQNKVPSTSPQQHIQQTKSNPQIKPVSNISTPNDQEIYHPVNNIVQKSSPSPISKKNYQTPTNNNIVNKFPGTKEEDDDDESYDLVFPDKYHKTEYTLLHTESGNDGKVIKYYDNDKKEIIFKSGVRKEIFSDGYVIVYFNNGDLKQIFPNQKIVYYFSEAKTIQTTYPDKLQVFKFDNGQIEKHYPDGTKQIAFPDGSLRYILPDGYEETYYLDGKVQKIDKNGVITLEHEDGYREIKYPDGREVCEYGTINHE